MIETFTKEEFEETLTDYVQTKAWEYSGLKMGEHTYRIPYKGIFISIRSSVRENDTSAAVGEDSIRLFMVDGEDNLLGKMTSYTTRVKGWQERLMRELEVLTEYRSKAGDCRTCKMPLHIFKVSKPGPNHGRPFASCDNRDHKSFVWLDQQTSPMFYGTVSSLAQHSSQATEVLQVVSEVLSDPKVEVVVEEDVPIKDKGEVEVLKEFLASLPEEDGELPAEALLQVVEAQKKAAPLILNSQQLEAINAPFSLPLRVLAGAGSGKTACLARRYSAMVDGGIVPNQIVAVTFNKLMAQELLVRIMALTPVPPDAQKQICTIHALCYRMLRAYFPSFAKLKVAPDYQVKKALEKILGSLEPDADNRPAWEEVYAWICTAKASCVMPDETRDWFSRHCTNTFYCDLLQDARIALETQLENDGYITFPDMLMEVEVELKTNAEFLRFWQSKYQYLIVDEAQDTGHQAVRILRLMFAHTNYITMVGDPDQLLYRFTGAVPEDNLYEGFEDRYPKNNTVMLPINYRSTKKIVATGLRVIANNYDPFGPYEAKYLKGLVAKSDAVEGVDIFFDSHANPIDEARSFVSAIKRDLELGIREPGDYFIAGRTRAQVGYMEAAFAPSGIPYVNVVGMSFFDLQHIKHVLAYMRIVADGHNETAFKDIINIASNKMTVPWKNASDYGNYCYHRFLTAEFCSTAHHYSGMMDLFRSGRQLKYAWMPGMRDLSELMGDLFAASENGPEDLYTAILDLSYRKYVQVQTGNADTDLGDSSKMDDLLTLRDFAKQFVTLKDFLQFVDSVIAATKAAQTRDWSGRVVLSTIHRLKGLERPVVMGMGMSEGRSGDHGLLPHTFSLVDPPNNGKLPGAGRGRIEDERCLFYVLVTRAREFLVLSTLENYREKPMIPSRFLDEIKEKHATD